ncbi:MAG: biopolymer transporter ExbD [Deltaproteobacteria bacterium]|nr:biopolymer transporter ExbD [Deltaproteobacteria bacterium]MBN2670708.1 biopolymer transporter ExbD [Deltaproteobacteria bacterium]
MAAKAHFQDEPITEINVVPLVDIVLVLLIIFMVTANFMAKPAIDLELPKADTAESKERNQFSLLLGKDGTVAVGEKRIDAAAAPMEFQRLFREYMNDKRQNARESGSRLSENSAKLLTQQELTMIIEADKQVSHGRIIHFIDLARKTGIYKYAFNVDAPEN